jgi:hypothetical protein
MKHLQFDSANRAVTPLGNYYLEKDYETKFIYLVYPDGTSKKGLDPKTLKILAEMHYAQTVLACLEQPLVALFSSPNRWRETTMRQDRLLSRGELTSNRYSLNEGIALCYSNQKEVLDMLREEVGSVCHFNNKGRLAVLELVERFSL